MEDCKQGIQLLIDMAKKGDEEATLILKKIDNLLDECEMVMLKKKGWLLAIAINHPYYLFSSMSNPEINAFIFLIANSFVSSSNVSTRSI